MKIYKTALVCLMTCAVAFFGCSCSLLEDDNNESSVPVTTSEKSSTSVKTTSKPKPTEPCVYNEPKTDYAYSTLTDDYVKKLYNQISDNIDSEYEPSFYAEGNLGEYQITQAVEAYKNDHPEVFWLKSYYEYENFDYETGIWLTYTMSGDKLVTAKKEFNTAVDTISKSVPYGTECEREEYIHNYIINNCDYDEEAAESEGVQGNENDAYGVFVDGKAVCEGYSKAFQILCNKADIDCIQLMGIVDSDNHVWNCVKIGGDWYQIDVTWDDVDDFIDERIFHIPWGHHIQILSKCKGDQNKAMFFVCRTIENNWSRVVLMNFLSTNLYERQGKAISNFEKILPDTQSDLAQEMTKDPYNFDFLTLRQNYDEKELKDALMEDVQNFLLELGRGFAFVGREYRLEVGKTEQFLDMLFYNIINHCYVVIEIKTRDFEPGDMGQLGTYVAAVDDILRSEYDNQTIGLLICKTKDNVLAKYAVNAVNVPIGISEYDMNNIIPENYKSSMPTIEEIEKELKS